MQTLYPIIKTIHLLAVITGVGSLTTTYFAHKQFWVLFEVDKQKGMAAFKAFSNLQSVGMTALQIVIVTGLAMLFIVDWVFLQQLWLIIKLILVTIAVINIFAFGKKFGEEVQHFFMNQNDPEVAGSKEKIKQKITTLQVVQMCIFGVVVMLSVFRFV